MNGTSRRVILSFGGGVDSTVICAAYLNQESFLNALEKIGKPITKEQLAVALPGPLSCAMFADPGSEYSHTYRNVEYARKHFESVGIELITVRQETKGKEQTIFEWLTDESRGSGILPLMPGSSHVCSNRFKGSVMQKKAKELYGEDENITWLIGIEANEKRRTDRFTMNQEYKTVFDFRYPLQDLNLDRRDCIEILQIMGWMVPSADGKTVEPVGKSSCAWCPFAKKWEIFQLFELATKEGADPHDAMLLEQAFEIERMFYAGTSEKYDWESEPINKHAKWHEEGEPQRGGFLKDEDGKPNREIQLPVKEYKQLDKEEKKKYSRASAAPGFHAQPFQTGFCDHAGCLHEGEHPHGPAVLVQATSGGSRQTIKEWFQEWKEQKLDQF